MKFVNQRRSWLANILTEDIDETPEDAQYQNIIKFHQFQRNIRKKKEVFLGQIFFILLNSLIRGWSLF